MNRSILLTSFATWKPQQRSNSSDDLLLEMLHPDRRSVLPPIEVFRQLPVNLPIARGIAIAKFEQLQPALLLCCGMAESRPRLSVESTAVVQNHKRHTHYNLDVLTAGLSITEISHDAGRFVCNSLYYFMLDYITQHYPERHCLFIHVPVLTDHNRAAIVADFTALLQRLGKQYSATRLSKTQ